VIATSARRRHRARPGYRSSAPATRPRRPGQQPRAGRGKRLGMPPRQLAEASVRGAAGQRCRWRARRSPAPASSTFSCPATARAVSCARYSQQGRASAQQHEGAGEGAGGVCIRQSHGAAARRPRARRRCRRQPGAHPRSLRLGGHARVLLQRRRRADQQPRPSVQARCRGITRGCALAGGRLPGRLYRRGGRGLPRGDSASRPATSP
jgi:hypothetical protein